MIYDGVNGYLSGDLSQPVDTVLAMTKGPIRDHNWWSESDPIYNIIMSPGATGSVSLEGTSDIALRDGATQLHPIGMDLLPIEDAVWIPIQTATLVSVAGSFADDFQFLRLIISASGTGYVLQAWVKWN